MSKGLQKHRVSLSMSAIQQPFVTTSRPVSGDKVAEIESAQRVHFT